MDRKTALAILLALIALSVCFSATASASISFPLMEQQPHLLTQFSVSVPVIVGAGLHNTANPLDQPTRHQIYNYIQDNPGVHFRGICTGLDLSVGVVQYHLSELEHSGLIKSVLDGHNKRYFEYNAFSKNDVQLTSLMRHGTSAQILLILAQNGPTLHRDIADSLGITSQALTWQMARLKDAGLISAEKVGVNVRYSLADPTVGQIILNLTGN